MTGTIAAKVNAYGNANQFSTLHHFLGFFCADLLSTGQYSLFYILSRDPIVQIGDVTEMVFTISPRNNHKSSGMIIVEYLQ